MALPLIGALVSGVASLFGASQEARAAQNAADLQAKTAKDNKKLAQKTEASSLADLDKSLGDALGQYDTAKTEASAPLDPYKAAGESSLSQIMALLGLSGPEASQGALSKFVTSPGYGFAMDQGVQALDRSAAAKGGLYSGAQGKALTTFGQGLANQEFGNYFDRLTGVSTRGQNAATDQSNIALSTGQSKAGALLGTGQNKANTRLGALSAITGANTAQGDARAGGITGAANAWTSGLQNISTIAGKYAGGTRLY